MSIPWEAVTATAKHLCPDEPLRVANLLIASACRRSIDPKAKGRRTGPAAQSDVVRLALAPLPPLATDRQLWQRGAELAQDAAYLGKTLEGMHSWAASYQRASTTQKALGAYATHDAFASALARLAMEPLRRGRIHRIIDPSVGAGNLLLAAIAQYGRGGTSAHLKRFILSLHGVELDPRARELCCLLLWLAGAECGVTLEQVSANIHLDNALIRDWWSEHELFEVVLMNPPWESLRHSDIGDPDGTRAATLARLSHHSPGAPNLPPLYTAQGTGDRNLFKGFVELVPHLLVEEGRLGALLPAAFASDAGLTELRERYLQQFNIARWTSYENRGGYFPIDGRYKFGLLGATRSNAGTRELSVRSFATEPTEVDAPHIALRRSDIALIGRQYHIIPELVHPRELEILRLALGCGTPLFQSGPLGRVRYRREVDLSLGRTKFQHVSEESLTRLADGTFRNRRGTVFAPLLEGRLVGAFDCSQKSWVSGSGRSAVWLHNDQRPLRSCMPQYVMAAEEGLPPRVAICDITASTNTRTVIATRVPRSWRCGNTAPVLEFEHELVAFAGLGILNSMVFDWVARRLVSGLHLNKFILEGLVWPQLTPAQVRNIGVAAWCICMHQPRSGLSADQQRMPPWQGTGSQSRVTDPIAAASVIEALVAKGFGLSEAHLSAIYDEDPSDRRGFWRYFDAEKDAAMIARRALMRLRRLQSSADS